MTDSLPLNIGIIAPEFPPEHGGMQIMALRLAEVISRSHRVKVLTKKALPGNSYSFPVVPALVGRSGEDLEALNSQSVDIWLSMNAGYSAIASRLRAPLVCYFHGNDFLQPWGVSTPLPLRAVAKLPFGPFKEYKNSYSRKRLSAGIGATAKILTNSFNTRSLIGRYYPSAPEPVVCPPGVEEKFFQSRRAARNGDNNCLNLLTVSRLQKRTRRKNVDGVLRALALLPASFEYRYQVVGSGDDLSSLSALAVKLGIADKVQFLGRVSDTDLLAAYRNADLFVLPVRATVVDVEGFGIVYVEANASGLPVLASASGGSIDAIVDGTTGILIDNGEPQIIAEGILRFARTRFRFDPKLLHEFALQFAWDRAAKAIEREVVKTFCNQAAVQEAVHPGAK